jgi:NAD(P)-dependent dehydrogenase (short-subunit alcohol dehydrogenase family)
MQLGLQGKVVLVTGASQGIGRVTAKAFAAEGCGHLHLTARNEQELKSLQAEITEAHATRCSIYPMDLSSDLAMQTLADAVGEVDVLFNNAGDIPHGSLEEVGDAAWRKGFDLKVYGFISLCRIYMARMAAKRSGVIVNDIGNSFDLFDSRYIAGGTGNAALVAFTRSLGGTSLDVGVRVVGVCPGPVATNRMIRAMKHRAHDLYGTEDRWE